MVSITPMIPSAPAEGYEAAQHGSAVAERRDRGWVVVSGADRRTYLHGLFTNDIANLAPGNGVYSAYLTPQGRMITDLWVYELGDVVLLSMPLALKDALIARLDQFIFTEDVQLGDVTSTFRALSVVGPESGAVIAAVLGLSIDVVSSDAPNVRAQFQNHPAIVLRTWDRGVDGFDVLVEQDHIETLKQAFLDAGVSPASDEALETTRVEAGVPKFHADMDEDIIPLEAGIEDRAISMTKGCYVGQEVIIRVLHRGHGRVAKKLVGLVLDGTAAPHAGAPVLSGDREIGKVTSVVWSPALARRVALGYVHRDFVAPGTKVVVRDRSGLRLKPELTPANDVQAEVSALPFVPTSI
jgi:tRNA-modifying protein YgfZ